jgi:hypothetical protein
MDPLVNVGGIHEIAAKKRVRSEPGNCKTKNQFVLFSIQTDRTMFLH